MSNTGDETTPMVINSPRMSGSACSNAPVPQACDGCRRSRKRCDMATPICGHCQYKKTKQEKRWNSMGITQGQNPITCVYPTPGQSGGRRANARQASAPNNSIAAALNVADPSLAGTSGQGQMYHGNQSWMTGKVTQSYAGNVNYYSPFPPQDGFLNPNDIYRDTAPQNAGYPAPAVHMGPSIGPDAQIAPIIGYPEHDMSMDPNVQMAPIIGYPEPISHIQSSTGLYHPNPTTHLNTELYSSNPYPAGYNNIPHSVAYQQPFATNATPASSESHWQHQSVPHGTHPAPTYPAAHTGIHVVSNPDSYITNHDSNVSSPDTYVTNADTYVADPNTYPDAETCVVPPIVFEGLAIGVNWNKDQVLE